MRKSLLVLVLLASGLPKFAHAEDCSTSMNQNTINQCADAEFIVADALLNAAYESAQKMMTSIDAELPAEEQGAVAALRDGQRAWITFRDKACEAEGYMMYGGSAQPMVVLGCMRVLTQQRTAALTELGTEY